MADPRFKPVGANKTLSLKPHSFSSESSPHRTAADESDTYVRPDFHRRLRSYLRATFGPLQMGRIVFGAAISQADDNPPDWGQGSDAYGVRAASGFGVVILDGGANLLLSEALREDTRYYPCSCTGLWPRAKHALISSFTARAGPDGHRVFSTPAISSPYAGAFGSLAWYPPRFGPKDAFRTGNYDLLAGIGTSFADEFLSPILRKLHL